ncbi:hypothetical protein [Acrocarpospora phusangensis]|nr:hypothetical protein [Acrocarpospora phusangensis]
MPVEAYQTFSILSPSDRMIRYACSQVGCEQWRNGWITRVDESTPLGREQATYIRHWAGRTFKESKTGAGITVFTFASGQRCFREHETRPQTFLTRVGDWRDNLGLIRRHTRAADWVEDFALHQDALATEFNRG